jgi:hypothetical protein
MFNLSLFLNGVISLFFLLNNLFCRFLLEERIKKKFRFAEL